MAAKISNAPSAAHPQFAQFKDEVTNLMTALAAQSDFHAGSAVRDAFATIRKNIAFMQRDRAMDADVRRITKLVAAGTFARSTEPR